MFTQEDLVYNDDNHTYSLPSPIGYMPGPTEVLQEMGFISEYSKNDTACNFGKAVHAMVKYDVQGLLNPDKLSPGLINPYKGYKKFREDFKHLEPIKELVEKPVFHPLHYYAGQMDLPMLNTQDHKEFYLFDIKTSSLKYQDHWELQVKGAYSPIMTCVLNLRIAQKIKCRILWLSDKYPTYEIINLKEPLSEATFLGLLTGYKWKKAHNKLRYKKIEEEVLPECD